MVICLEQGVDLHMAQLMPLPLTVSCFSKIQIGVAFLVPAHPGSPGKRAVKRVCVCVCVTLLYKHAVIRLSVCRGTRSVRSDGGGGAPAQAASQSTLGDGTSRRRAAHDATATAINQQLDGDRRATATSLPAALRRFPT